MAFWRALYMVDPANRTASIAEGIRALDIYLSTEAQSGTALRRASSSAPRSLFLRSDRNSRAQKSSDGIRFS